MFVYEAAFKLVLEQQYIVLCHLQEPVRIEALLAVLRCEKRPINNGSARCEDGGDIL